MPLIAFSPLKAPIIKTKPDDTIYPLVDIAVSLSVSASAHEKFTSFRSQPIPVQMSVQPTTHAKFEKIRSNAIPVSLEVTSYTHAKFISFKSNLISVSLNLLGRN